MNSIIFYNDYTFISQFCGLSRCMASGISDRRSLIDELSRLFNIDLALFPERWDVISQILFEAVRVSTSDVIIIHSDMPNLRDADQAAYMQTLLTVRQSIATLRLAVAEMDANPNFSNLVIYFPTALIDRLRQLEGCRSGQN